MPTQNVKTPTGGVLPTIYHISKPFISPQSEDNKNKRQSSLAIFSFLLEIFKKRTKKNDSETKRIHLRNSLLNKTKNTRLANEHLDINYAPTLYSIHTNENVRNQFNCSYLHQILETTSNSLTSANRLKRLLRLQGPNFGTSSIVSRPIGESREAMGPQAF